MKLKSILLILFFLIFSQIFFYIGCSCDYQICQNPEWCYYLLPIMSILGVVFCIMLIKNIFKKDNKKTQENDV